MIAVVFIDLFVVFLCVVFCRTLFFYEIDSEVY